MVDGVFASRQGSKPCDFSQSIQALSNFIVLFFLLSLQCTKYSKLDESLASTAETVLPWVAKDCSVLPFYPSEQTSAAFNQYCMIITSKVQLTAWILMSTMNLQHLKSSTMSSVREKIHVVHGCMYLHLS